MIIKSASFKHPIIVHPNLVGMTPGMVILPVVPEFKGGAVTILHLDTWQFYFGMNDYRVSRHSAVQSLPHWPFTHPPRDDIEDRIIKMAKGEL